MCDQLYHSACDCPFVYLTCRVPKCYGIRKLQTSHTSENPERKYLICQYEHCGDFQWLEDAIIQSKMPAARQVGCFHCGEIEHWYKNCPWDGCPCKKKKCGGRRKLLTSKVEQSSGKKFLKCSTCGDFQWFTDALSAQEKYQHEPTVTIQMTIRDLSRLSLK
ncbi:cycloartenol synthase [Ranunculus cassubicifolius]